MAIRVKMLRPIIGRARGNPAAGARMAAVNAMRRRARAGKMTAAATGTGRKIIMQRRGPRAAMMAPQGVAATIGSRVLAQQVGNRRIGRYITDGT